MSDVTVISAIVEGFGEVEALPVLIRRLVPGIEPDRAIEVRRPIRVNRGTMLKAGQLERYIELAARAADRAAVLVVLDADDDCAATLGPELLARAQAQRPATPIAVVVAVRAPHRRLGLRSHGRPAGAVGGVRHLCRPRPVTELRQTVP